MTYKTSQVSVRLSVQCQHCLNPNANDTRTRNRYRKLVPGNLYQFSGTSFSYQMKLEAKFLVPETNMADENVEADAQNNTLLRNMTPTNTGNHPHTQM